MKVIPVALAIFLRNMNFVSYEIWMQRRFEAGPLYNLWEFPGGGIEEGETPEIAMVREVAEEVDYKIVDNTPRKLFKIFPYDYQDRRILFYVFLVSEANLPASKGQWFNITFAQNSMFLKEQIPPANHQIIDQLSLYLKPWIEKGIENNLWK